MDEIDRQLGIGQILQRKELISDFLKSKSTIWKAILMNNLSAPLDAKQRMCEKCMALLDETLGIVRNGRFFHENCFTCSACHKILTDDYQFSATSDRKGVRSSSGEKVRFLSRWTPYLKCLL